MGTNLSLQEGGKRMDNEQLLQQIGGMFGQVNQQMGELARLRRD